jgi:ankyrin repeat protein
MGTVQLSINCVDNSVVLPQSDELANDMDRYVKAFRNCLLSKCNSNCESSRILATLKKNLTSEKLAIHFQPSKFRDDNGFNPMHHVTSHTIVVITELFSAEQITTMLQECNDYGDTPLHHWVTYGGDRSIDLCNKLLKTFGPLMPKGVYDLKNLDGSSPFTLAMYFKHFDTIIAFVKYTDCPKERLWMKGPNDPRGLSGSSSPIVLALRNDYSMNVEGMIRLGAPLESSSYDDPLLHIAVDLHRSSMAATLIRLGHTVNCRDRKGFTPLNLAAMRSHMEVFNLLIKAGAECHDDDDSPIKMMDLVARYSNTAMFLRCLEVGFSIQSVDGVTPLHYAISVGNIDMVKMIASHAPWTINMPNLVTISNGISLTKQQYNWIPFRSLGPTYRLLQALGCEVPEGWHQMISEDDVAEIRFQIYFANSLVTRCLVLSV